MSELADDDTTGVELESTEEDGTAEDATSDDTSVGDGTTMLELTAGVETTLVLEESEEATTDEMIDDEAAGVETIADELAGEEAAGVETTEDLMGEDTG
ncbi:hypothetical protein PSPO01_01700 [Paraphaeosphaeria sporulosa]